MKDKELHTLTRKIAAELSAADFPHLWRVRRNRREWYEMIYTSGAWLYIRQDEKRLEIRADHPPEMERAYNAPSITISATRTPEAIARDILQRIANPARAYFAECLQRTQEAKTKRATHAALLHKMEPFRDWQRTDSNGQRTEWVSYKYRARADVYSDHVSTLKIDNPTEEELIKILTILGEHTPCPPPPPPPRKQTA